MESFYGGRQGVSFVIVKQFDSIESMVQCFGQGAVTTNEVNYGEYVIIDTINKNNPDNGKVYRRGLNYQYSENNSLAGAEYIGQIVGPQGDSPEVSIDDFNTIINEPYNGPEKEYNMINGGIVKGAEIVYDNEGKIDENQSVFNDSIKYTWVTIRDEYGTVKGCKIGFVFPCITLDFIGTLANAYEKNNLLERIDNGKHPFFAQWNIKIPKGIKGNTLNNLEIEGSLAFKGTAYYGDKECTNKLGTLDEDTSIDFNNYDYTNTLSRPIRNPISNNICYVKTPSLENNKCVLVYKETNYDNSENGESHGVVLGPYNMISEVNLSEKGFLTVSYTYNDAEEVKQAIRWLHPENSFKINDDGTIVVTYNTTHVNEDGIEVQDSDIFDKKLKWIDDVWIESTGKEKDVNSETGVEGEGSQKIHIQYNNESDIKEIGTPINYIMETIITKLDNEDIDLKNASNLAENYHLLVLYSDPVYRAKLLEDGHCKTWRSKKFTDKNGKGIIRNDWYDMGYVRGESGGVHIIGTLEDDSLLTPDNPPEKLMNDYTYAGWSYAVGDGVNKTLYSYDYKNKKWDTLGTIGNSAIEPSAVIQQGFSTDEANLLNSNGIFLQLEQNYTVY